MPVCTENLNTDVVVMKSAKDGTRFDASGPLKHARERCMIPHEIAWCLIPGECLGQLARNPFCRWMLCHVDPDELSPIQPDNDQGIEQVEANGWDNKQVNG